MNTAQILAQLDRLYEQAPLPEAERFLRQSLAQALEEHDAHSAISLYNELTGLCRVTGREQEAVQLAERALALLRSCGLQSSPAYATTLINAATALRAAGSAERALELYCQVETLYRYSGFPPYETASLYNNMAQACMALRQHDDALRCLQRSRDWLLTLPDTESERATLEVNLTLLHIELGQIREAAHALSQAMRYFEGPGVSDPHRSSALAAAGKLARLQGRSQKAAALLMQAYALVSDRFGDCEAARLLRAELDELKKEDPNAAS